MNLPLFSLLIRRPAYTPEHSIQLGGVSSGEEFRQKLASAGIIVGNKAQGMLTRRDNMRVSRKHRQIDLVSLSGYQLGFSEESIPYGKICRAASRRCLKLCPVDTAPQVLLQGFNKEDVLMVGMSAIYDQHGQLCIFSIVHGSLMSTVAHDSTFFPADYKFLFAL